MLVIDGFGDFNVVVWVRVKMWAVGMRVEMV